MHSEVKYCTQCAGTIILSIPEQDHRIRAVCSACGHIHYDNPKMVVGTITHHQGQILLCRRAIEPEIGKWTLPGGFMECGESMAAGACRETLEEACAQVQLLGPVYHIVDIPHIGQTHLFFRAELSQPEYGAGEETLETRLFDPADIPWSDLVFRSAHSALRQWIEDSKQLAYPTRHVVLAPNINAHSSPTS